MTTIFSKNMALLQTAVEIGVMAQRHMSQYLTEMLNLADFLAGDSRYRPGIAFRIYDKKRRGLMISRVFVFIQSRSWKTGSG